MVFELPEMTRPDFEEYLSSVKVPIAIIPVGSYEQHGRHLPLGTDWITAYHFSKRLAEMTNAIVVPVICAGISLHHMNFKGTITLKQETLWRVLFDIIESLKYHGIRKVVLINGHGGNEQTCSYAQQLVRRELDVEVFYGFSLPPADHLLESYDWHAGPVETAGVNLYRPDLIKLENWMKPDMTLSPLQKELIEEQFNDPSKREMTLNYWFKTKLNWTDDVTNTGQIGTQYAGDIINDPAKMAEYRKITEKHLEELAKLINRWRED
jgi:creatinine amidohydrolase